MTDTTVASKIGKAAIVVTLVVALLVLLHAGGLLNGSGGWFNFPGILSPPEKDTDGDGIPDHLDKFPYDRDNDGYDDTIDLFPDSDIGILFTISTIEVKDQVGLSTSGKVYFTIKVDGVDRGRIDNSGEKWTCNVGSPLNVDKGFRFNVDDDVRNHTIDLTMHYEVVAFSYVLDIDGKSTGRTLNLVFDLVTESWTGNDNNGLADGSADGYSGPNEYDAAVTFDISVTSFEETKTYIWKFLNEDFSLQVIIPTSAYAEYMASPVSREQHTDYNEAQTFVTSDDPIIVQIATELKGMAQSKGYSEVQTINFVLRFCQSIDYSYDNISIGADEYWRFPVETLYDQTGDCEDTSFLFASLAEAMGYDAVIIFPPGHAAVGMASSSQVSGVYYELDGTRYYYCETTGEGWEMGQMPEEVEGEQAVVVQVQ